VDAYLKTKNMRKILVAFLISISTLSFSQTTRLTLPQIFGIWNTTSVPKGPAVQNTFYTLFNPDSTKFVTISNLNGSPGYLPTWMNTHVLGYSSVQVSADTLFSSDKSVYILLAPGSLQARAVGGGSLNITTSTSSLSGPTGYYQQKATTHTIIHDGTSILLDAPITSIPTTTTFLSSDGYGYLDLGKTISHSIYMDVSGGTSSNSQFLMTPSGVTVTGSQSTIDIDRSGSGNIGITAPNLINLQSAKVVVPSPDSLQVKGPFQYNYGSPAINQYLAFVDNKGNLVPRTLPGSLPPSGTAGGDLAGTYPNPTVTWSNGYTTYDARYIQGSGTTGTYPLFSGTRQVGNSHLLEDAGTTSIRVAHHWLLADNTGVGSTIGLENTSITLTTPSITLGAPSSSSPIFNWYNATNNNIVNLQSGVTSASYTLTMPTALGSGGLISANGSGALSFVSGAAPTGTAGGDLSGTYPNPTVAKINGSSVPSGSVIGDILYASGTNTWARLAAGTNGYILTLSGGLPVWSAAPVSGVTSVSGTTNRITSTGGATPVIDISASYVGQSSITTLGSISTGTWLGTAIADAYLAASYIKADGTRALTGNWNAGAYKITHLRDSCTGTLANTLPKGTTAQRPTVASGLFRFNTTTGRYEFGVNSSWMNHVRLSGDTLTGNLRLSATPAQGDNSLNAATTAYVDRPYTSSSLTVTNGGTTTIAGTSVIFTNLYASSSATATTIAYSNVLDGATVTIDYLKTTASNCVFTFPSGTVISASGSNAASGLTTTFVSSSSGEYTIVISRINSTYKVYISQDVY
jgi:hypothetical protein